MKINNSFSATLHILLHLEQMDRPLTSEQMAAFIDGNPAFIRKLLAGLRERHIVTSSKGHHGGWTLARPAGDVTLYDIYIALGSPTLFALGNRNENPQCLVEKGVNRVMSETFTDAESLILERFKRLTLAEVGREFIDYFNDKGQGE
ncbi:Rrf2 family transcriptional regulator [Superficieibacter sp. HKU1]|uniref:Rrf2 family transcriptional regulator n=1 Tax=Superficieibacter sp. HKU1 TaxID=3031919 RepID=UPI0023E143CC|nr:Rrf2 family transcriptional regulator [Superficieibacter sp. HKU1]WES68221.1 Rrf2 family transcriptional regulator [Superficieibacter sp. HKU1]